MWFFDRSNRKLNGVFIGAVLTDLSRAFDCIPHDLQAEKLHAYVIISECLPLCIHNLKA